MHRHACGGWAQVLEDEDLFDPTSLTGKHFRADVRLPYVPFFLGDIYSQSIERRSLTSNVSRKTRKQFIRSDGR